MEAGIQYFPKSVELLPPDTFMRLYSNVVLTYFVAMLGVLMFAR